MDREIGGEIIPSLLRAQARALPDGRALCHRNAAGKWDSMSWEETWSNVARIAAVFRRKGLKPGDRIAIVANTELRWQLAEMSILCAGGVVVGIEPYAASDHLQHILNSSGVVGLVGDSQAFERVPPSTLKAMKLSVHFDNATAVYHGCGVKTWENLTNDLASESPLDEPLVAADDPATIIYTSGTTGAPKAIEFSHGQLIIACRQIAQAFPQLRPGDPTICWLPMAHLFQRMMNLVAISRGSPIYFVEDPTDIVRSAGEIQPAVFVGVPRFYEKLYQEIQARILGMRGYRRRVAQAALAVAAERGTRLRQSRPVPLGVRLRHAVLDWLVLRRIRAVMGRRIKFMITGSAPIATRHLEFFHDLGWPVLEAYGVSENAIPMAANRPTEFRFGSVGKPFAANEIRFSDDGEILVKGPGLFTGYLGDDPGGHFIQEGFYRTGDIGHLDDDGFLFLVGRRSDVIKTSTGRRIVPARIEAKYQESSLVNQMVVVGHGRPHLVGLVTIDRPNVEARIDLTSVERDATDEEFAQHRLVLDVVRRDIETLGRELARHERVRNFAILPVGFSVAAGELTPTLKLRRERIAQRYADVVDQLYRESIRPVVTHGVSNSVSSI